MLYTSRYGRHYLETTGISDTVGGIYRHFFLWTFLRVRKCSLVAYSVSQPEFRKPNVVVNFKHFFFSTFSHSFGFYRRQRTFWLTQEISVPQDKLLIRRGFSFWNNISELARLVRHIERVMGCAISIHFLFHCHSSALHFSRPTFTEWVPRVLMLYAFFWVIFRPLNFICQRFGTLFILHTRKSWH
jgi:hypothetical protein